jgi:hypothetical protein
VAGDGTTTATVLAQAIFREGVRTVAAGASPMALKRGIERAVEVAVEEIKKLSLDVKGDMIAQVGTNLPQLKKVVLAMRNRLIYRDTFEEALAELTGGPAPARPALAAVTSAPAPAATEQGLPALAERLRRLRDQAAQLARELETLEKETRKK